MTFEEAKYAIEISEFAKRYGINSFDYADDGSNDFEVSLELPCLAYQDIIVKIHESKGCFYLRAFLFEAYSYDSVLKSINKYNYNNPLKIYFNERDDCIYALGTFYLDLLRYSLSECFDYFMKNLNNDSNGDLMRLKRSVE